MKQLILDMSFAGHVFDMIARIQYNESLRSGTKARLRKVREAYGVHYKAHIRHFQDSELTQEQLHQLRVQIRAKIIRDRRMVWLKSALVLILIFTAVGYFAFWLFIKD